jgi:hypothetical protein
MYIARGIPNIQTSKKKEENEYEHSEISEEFGENEGSVTQSNDELEVEHNVPNITPTKVEFESGSASGVK